MRTVELTMDRPQVAAHGLGHFEFAEVAGRIILTNDAAEWILLSQDDFSALIEGRLPEDHPQHSELRSKCFLRDGSDLDTLSDRVRRKKQYVHSGPHLHVIVATLRCNQSCSYCHASRAPMDREGVDMSIETARGIVDRAIRTPSPNVNFEFQGGEPTINMDVIRFVVDYARERNKHEGKNLGFSLITNMTTMDEDIAQWLIDKEVQVCTSLDGPVDLHDRNRAWRKASSAHERVAHWIGWFKDRYAALGRDTRIWHVDALLTVTKETLRRGPEVVDEYVRQGVGSIHLRPLNPYGFAGDAWRRIGYTTDEFLAFFAETLDYILELNKKGTQMVEGTAGTVLTKMLTADDPGYVDLRSPCGAGVGQMAYDYDGAIYPCDEARMVAAQGDRTFAIGETRSGSLAQDIRHPTVKAMAVASLTEALPLCSTCWNRPFCGVCPIHEYQTGSDLFGQRPGSGWCQRWMGISEILIERMVDDPDGSNAATFRRWTMRREREAHEPK